jgi:2-polyprenyl-6-methoxyphenol hydroxylase-like FAD-dependent oxidoreductase
MLAVELALAGIDVAIVERRAIVRECRRLLHARPRRDQLARGLADLWRRADAGWDNRLTRQRLPASCRVGTRDETAECS